MAQEAVAHGNILFLRETLLELKVLHLHGFTYAMNVSEKSVILVCTERRVVVAVHCERTTA